MPTVNLTAASLTSRERMTPMREGHIVMCRCAARKLALRWPNPWEARCSLRVKRPMFPAKQVRSRAPLPAGIVPPNRVFQACDHRL